MTTVRTETDAHAAMEHTDPWPLDFWLKERLRPIEEPREFAYGRWLLLGAAVIATGMGAVIWWLAR